MPVLDRFRPDDKRLFITGDGRGLGREMALAIAEAGADVVLVGRDADSLAQTAADIRLTMVCADGRDSHAD
jgi:NADP-dependent 3-hydroxy acid dehydrogenase YdfG